MFMPAVPPHGPNPTLGTTLAGLDYYTPNEPDNHPHQAVGRLHLALVKAAFACDLTRVATFSLLVGTSRVLFPALDGAQLPNGLDPPASSRHGHSAARWTSGLIAKG